MRESTRRETGGSTGSWLSKVIRPDMAGAAAFVESFRHEGIALAKLRHPGIVPIYDIRESEGLIYYVMPLVEGETLRQKLERLRRLPPSETQRILSELCDALGAAHRAKMVHRDIKPANVILEGNLEKALLMDFGIAKALTDDVEEGGAEPVVEIQRRRLADNAPTAAGRRRGMRACG